MLEFDNILFQCYFKTVLKRRGEYSVSREKSQEKKKCQKCKTKDATEDDGFCDNCRFMAALEGILKARKNEQ